MAEKLTLRAGKSRHSLKFIRSIVKKIEAGASRQEVCERYELSYNTLKNWVKQYGQSLVRPRQYYSEATKRSALRAVASGKLTAQQVMEAYGISTITTLRDWIRAARQKKDDLSTVNVIDVSKKKHPKPVSEDSDSVEVQKLKAALAEAQLKVAALNTLIDVAEHQLNIDIRKKPGAKQS